MASEYFTVYTSSTGAISKIIYCESAEVGDNYDSGTEGYVAGYYDSEEYYWNGATMQSKSNPSADTTVYNNNGRWYILMENMTDDHYIRYVFNNFEYTHNITVNGTVGLVGTQDADFQLYVGHQTNVTKKEGFYNIEVTITPTACSIYADTTSVGGSLGTNTGAPPTGTVDQEIVVGDSQDLDDYQRAENEKIDTAAAAKRKEVLTVNPGQDYVYVQKLEEANHYLANVGLNYRYWKIELEQTTRIQMSELEMAATVAGADVTTGSTTITASTEDGSHPASHALDGNGATWWETTGTVGAGAYEYLVVDFGSPQVIAEVRMTALANSSLPRLNFSIYGSNDGINWVETAFDKPDSTYEYTAGEERDYNPEINDGYYVLMGPEATARGITLLQLANEVVGQKQTINAQLGEIEAIRITKKADINAIATKDYISKMPLFVQQAKNAFDAL